MTATSALPILGITLNILKVEWINVSSSLPTILIAAILSDQQCHGLTVDHCKVSIVHEILLRADACERDHGFGLEASLMKKVILGQDYKYLECQT